MLSAIEKKRYIRHIQLEEIGLEGQKKICESKILVIGAGGLGCPALQYLTCAGVGKIGVADFDIVALSNLQRQILFTEEDIGKNKAETSVKHLQKLNTFAKFEIFNQKITLENAESIISNYDLILDCSDNFSTRYLINDICVKLNKIWIFSAIQGFEGQLGACNLILENGERSSTYRCIFPETDHNNQILNCHQAGILGATAGILGTLQALEALKIILSIGDILKNRILLLNVLTLQQKIIHIKKILPENKKKFSQKNNDKNKNMKEMTVKELYQMLKNNEAIQLIDVREIHEFEICHLKNSELIPVANIPENIDKIQKDKMVVVYCHHGVRSANVINYLKKNHQLNNLYNLVGGIHAWALHIDTDMQTY
ncbi:MAG: thiamine biosynthesis protein ThiF [Bacteroidetes bacterium]|nr:MAG: thiamine biosynthesis protein ThiF [Bacteroidota bacterium]TAG85980.1 MAG: thiamine biosynthesis protein ThiF [Bacteroidota bacterium]